MGLTDDSLFSSPGAVSLCVLASGSAGNCSVLLIRRETIRRAILIDLGLSPRRTSFLLAQLGLTLSNVDDVILTHFDTDHFHHSWCTALPPHIRVRIHPAHHRAARQRPLNPAALRPHAAPGDAEPLSSGISLSTTLMAHDAEGVAVWRFDAPPCLGGGTLAFATDLGHVPDELIDFCTPASSVDGRRGREGGVGGVDCLAIESNYCPKLQHASERPDFLKWRIMGGRGHLSNQQAAEAIRRIAPREHVVLLHLSRDCNTPETAMSHHAGADYTVTLSSQREPTRWIEVRGPSTPEVITRPQPLRPRQALFEWTSNSR